MYGPRDQVWHSSNRRRATTMARVRHRIGVAGKIDEIFRSLHEPERLNGWWATTTDGTPKEGHVLHLHFSDVVTLSFRIETLTPNARVCLRCVSGPHPWQESTLLFALNQDSGQVWVELLHENPLASEDDFLYFSTKWTCYLLSLRDLIEHGTGRPYPNDVKIHHGD